uniref:Uncharacterized protein n=1 Tax=Anguilla anguilla TaxID=7936 RepID=A0A0E9UME8_ANGAN
MPRAFTDRATQQDMMMVFSRPYLFPHFLLLLPELLHFFASSRIACAS